MQNPNLQGTLTLVRQWKQSCGERSYQDAVVNTTQQKPNELLVPEKSSF